MNKLLKANFYKLTKEKSIYVLAGLSILISIVAIIIYKVIGSISMEGLIVTELGNGETLFLSGIQLSQNAGMLMALGIVMYVGKEFSQNTIRNKIIVGYSKTSIYLSNFIMSVVVSAILYIVYELVVVCIGIPVFGWGKTFVFAEFIRQLINSLLILVTVSAVVNMITMLSRNLVTAILISVLGIIIIPAILSAINMVPLGETARTVMDIIMKSNFLGQSVLIGTENSVSFMIWVIVSSIITTAGITGLGCYLFEKMDVK